MVQGECDSGGCVVGDVMGVLCDRGHTPHTQVHAGINTHPAMWTADECENITFPQLRWCEAKNIPVRSQLTVSEHICKCL